MNFFGKIFKRFQKYFFCFSTRLGFSRCSDIATAGYTRDKTTARVAAEANGFGVQRPPPRQCNSVRTRWIPSDRVSPPSCWSCSALAPLLPPPPLNVARPFPATVAVETITRARSETKRFRRSKWSAAVRASITSPRSPSANAVRRTRRTTRNRGFVVRRWRRQAGTTRPSSPPRSDDWFSRTGRFRRRRWSATISSHQSARTVTCWSTCTPKTSDSCCTTRRRPINTRCRKTIASTWRHRRHRNSWPGRVGLVTNIATAITRAPTNAARVTKWSSTCKSVEG